MKFRDIQIENYSPCLAHIQYIISSQKQNENFFFNILNKYKDSTWKKTYV